MFTKNSHSQPLIDVIMLSNAFDAAIIAWAIIA